MCYPASFWYVTPPSPCAVPDRKPTQGVFCRKSIKPGHEYLKEHKIYPNVSMETLPFDGRIRYNIAIKRRQKKSVLWRTYHCNINIAKNKRVYPFVVGLTPNDNG